MAGPAIGTIREEPQKDWSVIIIIMSSARKPPPTFMVSTAMSVPPRTSKAKLCPASMSAITVAGIPRVPRSGKTVFSMARSGSRVLCRWQHSPCLRHQPDDRDCGAHPCQTGTFICRMICIVLIIDVPSSHQPDNTVVTQYVNLVEPQSRGKTTGAGQIA